MKRIILYSTLVLLVACTAKKVVTTTPVEGPTQADVDRMSTKYPGYTIGQLKDGKAMYEANCGTCHSLKKPAELNEEGWQKIVPPMVLKVNKKGQATIDPAQQETILRYLVTMSQATGKN